MELQTAERDLLKRAAKRKNRCLFDCRPLAHFDNLCTDFDCVAEIRRKSHLKSKQISMEGRCAPKSLSRKGNEKQQGVAQLSAKDLMGEIL